VALIRATDRQQQILDLAAQGRSDKEVAAALGISVHTVRTHLQRLYRAQGFTNRAEAVGAWTAAAQDQAGPTVVGVDAIAEQEERLSRVAEITAAARIPIQASPAMAQLDLVNHERAVNGLTAVEWDDHLVAAALESARRMAEAGHLDTVIHNFDGSGRVLAAENVGYWSGINDVQLHALFVADPKQRANVLGPHQAMGAAWADTGAGVAFLSVIFA
jgi:DNA-binding CsgD family transcriptional regulator